MARITALIAAGAAAAVAAGATVWAKRRQEAEDAALEQEIIDSIEEPTELVSVDEQLDEVPSDPPATVATASPATDDLTAIKGIGAVSAERLTSAGVTSFAQIAAWSDGDIDSIGAEIKASPDRIRHEDWVGQARSQSDD